MTSARDQAWLALGLGLGAATTLLLSRRSKRPRSSAASSTPSSLELRYFDVAAKGLGPTLCAEFSGLNWEGNASLKHDREKWAEIKRSGGAPFMQQPLLTTQSGEIIAQTVAIVNWIGQKAGTGGVTNDGCWRSWSTSQMLIAEAEDIYDLMQKFVPTKYVALGTGSKIHGKEKYDEFWRATLPKHLIMLEKFMKGKGYHSMESGGGGGGDPTTGELYLFSMLYQAQQVCPGGKNVMLGGEEVATVCAWYDSINMDSRTIRVVSGKSVMGELKPYFR